MKKNSSNQSKRPIGGQNINLESDKSGNISVVATGEKEQENGEGKREQISIQKVAVRRPRRKGNEIKQMSVIMELFSEIHLH